jgi:hypothetical protein
MGGVRHRGPLSATTTHGGASPISGDYELAGAIGRFVAPSLTTMVTYRTDSCDHQSPDQWSGASMNIPSVNKGVVENE